MRLSRRELMVAALAGLSAAPALAAPERFKAREFETAGGRRMPYRLFTPETAAGPWPVVLWLHGAGGRGNDNLSQISGGNSLGATLWTADAVQGRTPVAVIAPQCPAGDIWATMDERVTPTVHLEPVSELLGTLTAALPIDPSRVYVVGQSMGGFGAWALAARYPDRFAAVIAMCGGGDLTRAADLARTPAWAFHGALDKTIPVSRSRDLVQAIRQAGGAPRYNEYPDVDHLVWEVALREPDLLPWLFAQRRA